VLCVPFTGSVPPQAPEAVHEVALVDDQVNVEVPPLAMLFGLAISDTLGGAAETVTVADCVAEPPTPVHVSVNLVVAVRADVDIEPLVPWLPPQPPDAAQEVALVDDQVNVDATPLLTVLGLAEMMTAGASLLTETVADWVALPPVPVQVIP
jgi:hypothetical protein